MLTSEVNKKYAIRDLVRDYNTGRMNVVFKDSQTGQILNDLTGYEIITSGNFMDLQDLGIDPVKTPTNDSQQTTSQQVVSNAADINSNESDSPSRGGGGTSSRNPSNNFGYMATPGLMTAASYVPGFIGTAARAGRVGLGLNEAAAANAARQSIGMEDTRSFMGKAKDAVMGREGYIGDISTSDGKGRSRSTPVGFEAQDPAGRTTFTPEEARSRMARGLATTTTQDDTKAAMKAFTASDLGQQSKSKGVLSQTFDSLRSVTASIMDTVLGRTPTQSIAQAVASKAAETKDTSGWSGDTGTASTSQFGAPTNETMSVASQYGSYGAGKEGNSFGGSAQADAAAANPDGGLY
jgi:hypothetical protein